MLHTRREKTWQRGTFGRTPIDDPHLFPPEYIPAAKYRLQSEQGSIAFVAHLDYAVDVTGTGQMTHIGSCIMNAGLGIDLHILKRKMGVDYALYDVDGKMGAGTITMPNLDFKTIIFANETVIPLTEGMTVTSAEDAHAGKQAVTEIIQAME